MPTYEYYCKKCDSEFELFQNINDDPITKCPKCGADGTVERLISAGAGLIFKGSGFYTTDYKNNGNGSKNLSKRKESNEKKSKADKETQSA